MTTQSIDTLDAHIHQAHNVRSILWAMTRLLQDRREAARLPQAVVFELHQLTAAGLRLADDFVESLEAERPASG